MGEISNTEEQWGCLAAKMDFFGECNRYAFAPVYQRFGGVMWYVWDAESVDEDGNAQVIGQNITQAAVIAEVIFRQKNGQE